MGYRSQLDHQMLGIRDDLLRMSSLVAQAIERTFKAFAEQDERLAHDVINGDTVLDELHQKIEHECETTVALQQPAARDLRTVIASLLISSELERMGDHAEGIARTTLRSQLQPGHDIPAELRRMKDLTLVMLRDAMDAFVASDVEKARHTARLDDEADRLYKALLTLLIQGMSSGVLPVERGTYLLWTGHNFERICDRATNICERVIYKRTGDFGNLNP